MLKVEIKQLESIPDAPMELLLLADPSETIINDYLERGKCYIANYEDKIVGVVVILKTRPRTIEIMNIAVKEEYQNQGIGRQLIGFVINQVKKENINNLEIGTGNPGVQQMLLYQKCGFRIVGVDFDFFRLNYKERIYENGIECRDMIRMKMELDL